MIRTAESARFTVEWLRGRRRWAPVALGIPAVLAALATLLPLLYLVIRAFAAGSVWELLLTPRALDIVLRSLLLVGTVTVATIVVGVLLAWLTVRTDLPFGRLWLMLATLPLVIPTYVGGFLFIVALGPKGMLQQAVAPLGVDRLPDLYGFPGAFLILTLHTYPYVMLIVRAAMHRIDPTVEEAARTLGKGPWTAFWQVTLPQLRPAIVAGGLLVALYTLGDFGAVSLMNYEAFTWAIFIQYESAFDRAMAAALSLVLALVATGILVVESGLRRPPRYHRSSPGVARRRASVRLRWWRWPSLAFCAILILLALVLPTALLGYWAVRGILDGEPVRLLGSAVLNSVSVAGLAALATVVAALPMTILCVRYPSGFTRLLERATYIGFALPRIAIALGLVFFATSYAMPLYQTPLLLVFAYALVSFPTAVGSLGASIRQVNPRLEEAARALGRRPGQVFATITLPLVWPGVLSGAALVFLLTMEELPMTLVLRPAGMETLATAVWSAASEALFAQAAVPALLLIFASSLAVALLYWRDEGLA